MTSHLVSGYGQVGKALVEVLRLGYPDTEHRDQEDEELECKWLHIAFPWSEGFVGEVVRQRELHKAKTVIVHSTVPVGTCDLRGWVHSPIRGRHPDLSSSIHAFVKMFGSVNRSDATEIAAVFRACGVRSLIVDSAAETEAGKLWELTQFAVAVVLEKQVHSYCRDRALDPSVVYRTFAQTYNEGYSTLDEERFVRPILDHMPGPIGGHCVVPGISMLDDSIAEKILLWVKEIGLHS